MNPKRRTFTTDGESQPSRPTRSTRRCPLRRSRARSPSGAHYHISRQLLRQSKTKRRRIARIKRDSKSSKDYYVLSKQYQHLELRQGQGELLLRAASRANT
jgi:hypothetical protein